MWHVSVELMLIISPSFPARLQSALPWPTCCILKLSYDCCTGDGTVSEADLLAFQARENGGHQAIPQREADLVPLWAAVTRATNGSSRQQAYAALSSKLDERVSLDAGIRAAVQDVLSQPQIASKVAVGPRVAFSKAQQTWVLRTRVVSIASGAFEQPQVRLAT